MRVALVSEHAHPFATLDVGGQHVHVAELATALARRGHEVHVYTRRDTASTPAETPGPPGVTVLAVPAGPAEELPKDRVLPYLRQFGDWLAASWRGRGWRPDVVHGHFWMGGLACLVATSEIRVPVVQTFHALGSEELRHQCGADTSPAQRIGLERMLGRVVERVIAQSRHEVGELVRLGVPRTSIRVVPSGVDTELFRPADAAAGGGAPVPARTRAGGRILSVGRLVPRKGFDDLVRALPLVPEAELVIAGGPAPERLDDDPQAGALRILAAELGVLDQVRLLGAVPRSELPNWYRSATVVACTPWYEPFGLTPLEAMACGVPVVAYAVGGLTETIVDKVTGVLVSPGQIHALAVALRRLLADEALRLSYASAGGDRARSRYPWERTAAEVERVYAELSRDRVGQRAASAG